MSRPIIHISGPSGSGKSALGDRLKKKFGTAISVVDLDDLRRDFIAAYYGKKKFARINKTKYQEYIDKFIKSHRGPLVIVGLNHMPWWHANHYYNVHSTHNYFIDLDDDTILKQKCVRLFTEIVNDTRAMDDVVNNNGRFQKLMIEALQAECDKESSANFNAKWRKDYKLQGYKFLSRSLIYYRTVGILERFLLKE